GGEVALAQRRAAARTAAAPGAELRLLPAQPAPALDAERGVRRRARAAMGAERVEPALLERRLAPAVGAEARRVRERRPARRAVQRPSVRSHARPPAAGS